MQFRQEENGRTVLTSSKMKTTLASSELGIYVILILGFNKTGWSDFQAYICYIRVDAKIHIFLHESHSFTWSSSVAAISKIPRD